MAITFQEKDRIFTLNTAHTTYQMKADQYGYLLHLYYGKKIYDNMDYLLTFYNRGFCGNPAAAGTDRTYSLDLLPLEYPSQGVGDYRSCAVNIMHSDGSECCDLRYISHEIISGKYGLPGLPALYADENEAQTLKICLKDSGSKVRVDLYYGVLEKDDLITRSVVIANDGEKSVTVLKAASACLDFLSGEYELISFYGRHAMERMPQRLKVGHGSFSVGSRRGMSSHQYNPAVILAEKNTSEDQGNCYGLMFVYSGNFLCETQKDQFDQTRILMGTGSDLFHYRLDQGERLVLPETVLSFSDQGLGNLSRQYHHCIREHICRGKYARHSRPLLLNSWEAVYFHFTGESIYQLALQAKDLGIDMVVMDDGWFGKREDDNSSLGDWQVNEKKLGCSLGELAHRIQEAGVAFGIWMEPEMVSEDSNFYRAHPDWVLRVPGREPVRGRNQLVLDFSREEVRAAVFEQVCQVLDQADIGYLKWDMNRSLEDFYSSECSPGKVAYDYVLGLYDFLEKLLRRYPDLLIEGCCGGGGRFDAGMLYYTPQIWCSDNTDAVDRTLIQYGTSFFYPPCTVGAHVSASPSHQTGRSVSMTTRGVTAMAGTFGYELNPAFLTEEEKGQIRKQVSAYREYELLLREGEYYRLSDPFEDIYAAWAFISDKRDRALLSVVMLQKHDSMPVSYVKLKGLEPEARYENRKDGKVYSGAALMEAGLPLPVKQGEYQSFQYYFCKIHDFSER